MIEELLARSREDKTRGYRISGKPSQKLTSQTVVKKVKPEREIIDSFPNTTTEHINLRLKRETSNKTLNKRLTGKEYVRHLMETHQDMKDGFQSEQEKLNKLKEEVKALPDILKPNPNPRTYNMILAQKKMRRAQHLEELRDFEKKAAFVKGECEKRIDSLKQDVEGFLNVAQDKFDKYYGSLSDSILLNRELDIVVELADFSQANAAQLTHKLQNIDAQLDKFEDQFLNDIEGSVGDLRAMLIEIAFKLEPEVNEIVAQIRDTFKQDIESNKSRNKQYFEVLKQKVNEMIEALARNSQSKEAHWRVLKNNQVVSEYQAEIAQPQYRDPLDRRDTMAKLDEFLAGVIRKREQMIKDLYAVPIAELSKAKVAKFVSDITALEEDANKVYDDFINTLMELKVQCLKRVESLVEDKKSRILHYAADLKALGAPDTHDEYFKLLFDKDIEFITRNQNDTLKQVVDFLDERDRTSSDVCGQVGRNMNKFADRLDRFFHDQEQSKLRYELEKAKLEDENNENLERLAKNLDEKKQALRMAKDHGELDTLLQECFVAVDQIDEEFRAFHSRNKEATDKHLPIIEEVFALLENDLLILLQLLPMSSKDQLEQLYDKVAKYKAKIKTDSFIKDRDEREQKELEDLLEKNKNNKGFKPPKPKALDAKKAAAEWQELFNKYYAEQKRPLVTTKVEQTGTERIVNKSIKAFSIGLMQPLPPELTEEEKLKIEEERKRLDAEEQERKAKEEEEVKKRKGAAPAKPTKGATEDQSIEPAEDPEDIQLPEIKHQSPIYEDSQRIFTQNYLIELAWMINLETAFRKALFDYFIRLKTLRVSEAQSEDQAFVEMSLILLDERLRKYYSMKGKIQTEIYYIRSGEITTHKTHYQKIVAACLDSLDQQTEEFNSIYKSLFDAKENHSKKILELKEILPAQTSLINMQGVMNVAKDRDFKFGEQTNLQITQMMQLANQNLLALKKSNLDSLMAFSKDVHEHYSENELVWYRSLLIDVDKQIDEHQQKRNEITRKIEELAKLRREEALKKFTESYEVAIDELAAKNATGKVFGKPRRVAQEIVRSEISHCIRADQTLTKMVDSLAQQVSKYNEGNLSAEDIESLWKIIRQKLMAIRSCSYYFGRYLMAFVDKSPLEEMPRCTYAEDSLDSRLKEHEKKEDDERKVRELVPLDQIYYRGDKVKFGDKIKEMEDAVSKEVARLYVQQYARFLGPDKTTDVLRAFVASLRKEMEEFRITAIRGLRTITDRVIDLSPDLNRILFGSIDKRLQTILTKEGSEIENKWKQALADSEALKQEHLKKLRPGMAHPFNKEDLEKLNSSEQHRFDTILQELENRTLILSKIYFDYSNTFFQRALNSFYFLCLFYDNWILHEDYIKLPGDESVEKAHLSLKKLMIMQQKGELKDTSSLRSIVRKWKNYPLDLFALTGSTFEFKDVTSAYPAGTCGPQSRQERTSCSSKTQRPP